MNPFKILSQGDKYSKKDLSTLLEQPTLSLVREGLYHCKNSESTQFKHLSWQRLHNIFQL